MFRILVLSCVTFALSASGVSAITPKKVHVAAGVDASEEEAERYLKANLSLVQKDVPQAIRTCAKAVDPALVSDFEFAVEVGKDGKPGKSVPTPSTPFTTCVTRAVGSMKFTEPPRAPLGVYFEVAIRE
ncbi:MAG TPA: hypothetical protein VFV75_01590 [Candidatus Polarisedimenticolaceae bacterium]|nr:hypothetical protein [Candidatus Polarisedimenticolaceae bacterium]